MPTSFVNPHVTPSGVASDDGEAARVRAFHRSFDGYAPSPLVAAPALAAELGVGALHVKDESSRFGLPSFKVLGASWGLAHAVCDHLGRPVPRDWAELQAAAAAAPALTVTCATDGNHGRAVAALARRLGLRARILVPDAVSPARVRAIADEGAEVAVVPVGYDEAVRMAAADAGADTVVVSDTSWPGYEDVPRKVVGGYATIFAEVDEQLAAAGEPPPDVVVVQMGVGAFAAAAVACAKAPGRARPARVLGVEPDDAACVLHSLEAGEVTTVAGPHRSCMDGLNCGTPSLIAWPLLRDGLDAVVAVGDDGAHAAMRDLARAGVVAGESGAAGLAGLRAADGAARAALGLGAASSVLLISTEGATDPDRYRAVVGAGAV